MKRKTTLCIMGVAFSVVLTLLFSTVAFSRTIYVGDLKPSGGWVWPGSGTSSDPYIRIQTAINVARRGDIVRVRPGTYRERITLKDGVRVLGSSPKPVIDGENRGDGEPRGSIVTAGGVGSDTEFGGFKIINGKSEMGNGMYIENSSLKVYKCVFANNAFHTPPDPSLGPVGLSGGGIYMTNASPVIEDCIFRNNGSGCGGAISMGSGSNPQIDGCTFESNGAHQAFSRDDEGGGARFADARGGAIDINDNCRPIITGCKFLENLVSNGNGGAISVGRLSTVTIDRCVFDRNNVITGGGGGAIYCREPYGQERNKPRVYISNSTFWRNRSLLGSGIYAYGPAYVRVLHCTFFDNAITAYPVYGSALHSSGSGSLISVWNSIIWGNESPQTETQNGGRLIVYDSDVEGGHSGYGNIADDPMFVDETNGNFHLRSDSPCIDAGYHYGSLEPEYDIDLDDRVIDGNDDGRSEPDMGVDEYDPYPMEPFQYNGSKPGL